MTEFERAVLEAAFDLAEAQTAIDCGVPMGKAKAEAYRKLLDACSNLASENNGILEISE